MRSGKTDSLRRTIAVNPNDPHSLGVQLGQHLILLLGILVSASLMEKLDQRVIDTFQRSPTMVAIGKLASVVAALELENGKDSIGLRPSILAKGAKVFEAVKVENDIGRVCRLLVQEGTLNRSEKLQNSSVCGCTRVVNVVFKDRPHLLSEVESIAGNPPRTQCETGECFGNESLQRRKPS